jgi:Undecaprenyl-phosphate glucose phosphotransferase
MSIEAFNIADLAQPTEHQLRAVAVGGKPCNLELGSSGANRRERLADETRTTLCALLGLTDIAVPAISGVACYWWTYGVNPLSQRGMIAIVFGAVLCANCLHLAGFYRFERIRNWRLQTIGVAGAWIVTAITIAGLAAALEIPHAFLQLWAVRWFEATLFALVLSRLVLNAAIRRWRRKGLLAFNVAIVDMGGRSQVLMDMLQSRPNSDVHVLGVFHNGGAADAGTQQVDDLVTLVRESRVDEIIVSCPELPIPAALLRRFDALPINLRVWSDVWRPLRNGITSQDALKDAPLLTLSRRPMSGGSGVVKRLEDLIVSGIALLVFAPFMPLIALAIKLESKGPVIFRQQRFGFNSNNITIYKFRTMVESAADDPHCAPARRNDPRVTRVGRFLRQTSLDELPQLFNVLRGDMSLVGPRPHAVLHDVHFASVVDGYLARHRVKPGITGWAQVNGLRGEVDSVEKVEKRLKFDLEYIDHWSLWFDLKILFRTILVGFINENAY